MAQTGYTPISIYYSSTAGNTPTAGNLVAGELAINTADGKLFYKDSAGVVQVIGTKGGVGSSTTTQVLYNSSGLVVGSANMTFNGTGLTLANDASISGVSVGQGAGGSTNTVLGNGAVTAYTNTTAIGYQAISLGGGGNETAVGYQALKSATSSSGGNVAIGRSALTANTSGTANVAVGMQALNANTTASNNTAVGYQAGYTNTTGTNNAYFGTYAGLKDVGSSNTYIGYFCGSTSTGGSGSNNVALGQSALQYNTSGGSNVAVGRDSLVNNTTASNNTAVGYQAGYNNTTGTTNTFIGRQTGFANTVGSACTYLGYNAGVAATGSNNTFIGEQSGLTTTTGTLNTFVGWASGYLITSGGKNSVFGGFSGNQGGLDIRTASNYIVLSDGDGNPREYFDGSGNRNTYCQGTSAAVKPAYDCRSWVCFNGQGTVAILGSGNVSSITDNGTGDYTINFTTAMTDANYAITGMNNSWVQCYTTTKTSSAYRMTTFNSTNGTNADYSNVSLAVIR